MKIKKSLHCNKNNTYLYRSNTKRISKYKLYGEFIHNYLEICQEVGGRIDLHDITILKDWFGYKIKFKVKSDDNFNKYFRKM